MAKKLTRVQRTQRLTPEEIERDRLIRAEVEREFPPANPPRRGSAASVPLRELLAALKAARQQAGLSLAEMTERTGIEPPNLSKLENDADANPTLNTVERYASALGKSIRVWLRDDAPSIN
jgi:DNA-binding XRE family transcriptional regulator